MVAEERRTFSRDSRVLDWHREIPLVGSTDRHGTMTTAEAKINNLEAAMARMQADAERMQAESQADRILEDNAAMRDQVRKDSKSAQASPSVGNYKLSVQPGIDDRPTL